MSSDRRGELFTVRRYLYKKGDFEIDNPCVDKIALHPFMAFWGDNSKIAERLQAIRNMAIKEDDILIAAYPKCVQFYGTWFAYEREMSRAKKENKNILTVHFEKLKSDPVTEIQRITDFINIHVTDNLVKDIADKCDFKNLKKADKDIKSMGQEMKVQIEACTKNKPSLKLPEIYRKGSVADWKNHFTVAQNETFDVLIEIEMKDIDLNVFYEITNT